VASHLGGERYGLLPTLFWLNSSDLFLQGICWTGALFSLSLIFGLAPVPVLILLWFFYLSLFHIGGVFLGYQWDVLLLETGFLAIFFARDPSRAFLWLLRWLLFRLTFSSGMVKLLSGDLVWRDFTALTYHYETQPLPTWIGYYASLMPLWFQKFSCALMFGIELGAPFFIFTPKRTRRVGGLLMIALQILIMATGNYNFFNLLTIALCLTLFDDASFRRLGFLLKGHVDGSRNWPKWVIGPMAVFVFGLSWIPFLGRLAEFRDWPKPIQKIYAWVDPFELVNSYGLFAVMTKSRPEITIEGSRDGTTWVPYEFLWKPGDLKGRPKFVEPHQPRLDWQMWFQALAPYHPHSWFQNFLFRLLQGSPDVLALMKRNPFHDEPPRYIRATITDYHFTDLATQKATGEWWEKGAERPYSPMLSLESP
jgi:lipase maturation factor 1